MRLIVIIFDSNVFGFIQFCKQTRCVLGVCVVDNRYMYIAAANCHLQLMDGTEIFAFYA